MKITASETFYLIVLLQRLNFKGLFTQSPTEKYYCFVNSDVKHCKNKLGHLYVLLEPN